MDAGASSEGKPETDHQPKMSPAATNCRGVAAYFTQPVDQHDAVYLRNLIEEANVRRSDEDEKEKVQELEYRCSDGDIDIVRHVFRWDKAPYEVVFKKGLVIPRRLRDPLDRPSLNLEDYAKSKMHLDTRETKHGFIMTTINSSWFPGYVESGSSDTLTRYEIYAPGGIMVAQTLGDRYLYAGPQDEVAFVYGIAPQFIRSAQVFTLSKNRGSPECQRMDNNIYMNTNFDPQPSPAQSLRIQNPVGAYVNQYKLLSNLDPQPYPWDATILEHYKVKGTDVMSYIDAAFRGKNMYEAYIFMKTEYVIINYAPGGKEYDRKLHGPEYIGQGFPCLAGTAFAEYGIDAAFAFLDNTTEAMIFSGDLCARIHYGPPTTMPSTTIPSTTTSWLTKEPKPIKEMFPCLKGTKFAEGIDCAFATKGRNAYLFKGTEYALIDHVNGILIATRPIKQGFLGIEGTGFSSHLNAALATHEGNYVYLFKDNRYIKLYYTPGKMGDEIVIRPQVLTSNWHSLKNLLPRKNIAPDRLPGGDEVPDDRNNRSYI